jgi:hypothetical protein
MEQLNEKILREKFNSEDREVLMYLDKLDRENMSNDSIDHEHY